MRESAKARHPGAGRNQKRISGGTNLDKRDQEHQGKQLRILPRHVLGDRQGQVQLLKVMVAVLYDKAKLH